MKRGMIVIAMLFSLTACTGQQVQDAALFTAGAVLRTAIEIDEVIDERYRSEECLESAYGETAPALFSHGGGPCSSAARRREKARNDAVLEAAEAYRTAQRRAELDAALDAYLTAEPGVEPEQRSIVVAPSAPVVPPEAIERFEAVVSEAGPDD